MNIKRLTAAVTALVLCAACAAASASEVIPPAYPVPESVTWLLEVASGEVGYTEGAHGWSKYGEWAGDPYAQWCAEFLCWCVDQVDQQHGTHLLRSVWPMYGGSNSGRNWYIDQGRYIVRWGNLDGWGYQWLKGEDSFLTTGSYIPQPGDWVFFTWNSNQDTDHVALVEYCTRETDGRVLIHVIEGNVPSSVQRATYDLTYTRILGYGTVHDAANWTIRSGNRGMKVRLLQENLAYLGLLPADRVDGICGSATIEAVKEFQRQHGIRANGIANIETQNEMERVLHDMRFRDPDSWVVEDSSKDDFSLPDFDLP